MVRQIWDRIENAERRFRRSFGTDIATPRGRALAWLHYHLFDHAMLRVFWTNFWPVAPGVWRSNQPTHRRFRRYRDMGIRTVINLRGEDTQSYYHFERESCAALGLTLVNAKLWARAAARRERIIRVIDALRAAERPMVFHCKSGADRAGFVAALYQMVFQDVPVEQARRQLGLKYIHLKSTKTGVLDYILDVFEARQAMAPIGFEDWIRTEYAPDPIQTGFDTRLPPAQVADRLRDAA